MRKPTPEEQEIVETIYVDIVPPLNVDPFGFFIGVPLTAATLVWPWLWFPITGLLSVLLFLTAVGLLRIPSFLVINDTQSPDADVKLVFFGKIFNKLAAAYLIVFFLIAMGFIEKSTHEDAAYLLKISDGLFGGIFSYNHHLDRNDAMFILFLPTILCPLYTFYHGLISLIHHSKLLTHVFRHDGYRVRSEWRAVLAMICLFALCIAVEGSFLLISTDPLFSPPAFTYFDPLHYLVAVVMFNVSHMFIATTLCCAAFMLFFMIPEGLSRRAPRSNESAGPSEAITNSERDPAMETVSVRRRRTSENRTYRRR